MPEENAGGTSHTTTPGPATTRASLVTKITAGLVGVGALLSAVNGIIGEGGKTASSLSGLFSNIGSARGSESEEADAIARPSGLRYKVLAPGDGEMPTADDVVLVNYSIRLENGSVVDKTTDQPAPLPLNGVIPGLKEGVMLMSRGAKFRMWIPPELAYGKAGAGTGTIPPDSRLIADVELVDFVTKAKFEELSREMTASQANTSDDAKPATLSDAIAGQRLDDAADRIAAEQDTASSKK